MNNLVKTNSSSSNTSNKINNNTIENSNPVAIETINSSIVINDSVLTDNNNSLPNLKIERNFYELDQLNSDLEYRKPKKNAFKEYIESIKVKEVFMKTFPIIPILRRYSWKDDFIGDLIAGCTVTVMHIQGMGYALLANVPPVVGMYMAVFPIIFYFIFGTARHNSMGSFAVVTIMVGKIVSTHSNFLQQADVITNYTSTTGITRTPIEVASTVCFLVGIMHLLMFIFRLGVVSFLLSEALVSGFTTGAAIHIIASQLKDLIGITIPAVKGNFEVISIVIDVCRKISHVNWIAIAISVATIIILLINIEWLKPKLAKKTRIPFPMELVVVIIAAILSRYLKFETELKVSTIGYIPTGIPEFKMPDLTLVDIIWTDCLTIAIVSYSLCVSVGIIFAQKMNYEIDYNQELLAMGAGNIFGAFLSCTPIAPALSRSTLQAAVGGKTQLASLISSVILIVILLWIGPFFETLPRSVLAGIIVVALKGMLLQVTHFYNFYKLSKLDGIVWLVTFLVVVIYAIDLGLFVGLVLSLLCIFIRGLKPYTCLLGNVRNSELYLDITRYKGSEEVPNIKIFHYCGCINFASRSLFKSLLCNLLQINLGKEIRKCNASFKANTKYEFKSFKILIIDFSSLSYIDTSGVITLKQLIKEFNELDLFVFLAGCSCPAYEMMKKCDLLDNQSETFKIFPTVYDAVHYSKEFLRSSDMIRKKL